MEYFFILFLNIYHKYERDTRCHVFGDTVAKTVTDEFLSRTVFFFTLPWYSFYIHQNASLHYDGDTHRLRILYEYIATAGMGRFLENVISLSTLQFREFNIFYAQT